MLSSPVVIDGSADLNHIFTPFDLAADAEGNLFVLDVQQSKVLVLNPEGEFLYEFGGSGEAPGEFVSALFNFDLSDSGEVFAVNNGELIEVFSQDGRYVRRVNAGAGMIFDISVADTDRIYISRCLSYSCLDDADEAPAVIQIDSTGETVREFGCVDLSGSTIHEKKMLLSCTLDIDDELSLYYTGVSNYHVFKYDSLGALLWSVEGDLPVESFVEIAEMGNWLHPVIWDLEVSGGLVYVLWAQGEDDRGYRVDVFDADDGVFLGYFFTGVTTEPWCMSMEVTEEHFYVVDYENARIYRYDLFLTLPAESGGDS